jgi:hypothetical protein
MRIEEEKSKMIKLVMALAAAATLSAAAWVVAPTASIAQSQPSCDTGGATADCNPGDYEGNGGNGGSGNSDADGGGSSTNGGGNGGGNGGDDPGAQG